MNKLILTIFIIVFLAFNNIYATNHSIQAGDFSFTPNSIQVTVGDTITWTWVAGIHTTTSTQVPSGAPTWDNPLDATHTSFIYKVTVAGQYNYQCTFHVLMGMTGTITANPIAIKPISGSVPKQFKLYQNYPNPFNPVTTIKFDVSKAVSVKLMVFDLRGGMLITLVNQRLNIGSYSVNWDASKSASGLFFYKLETPNFTETHKMILVK